MQIKVYYEDKNHPTIIEVPDKDCEIWVEKDFQLRLKASSNKGSVVRRTAQEIMEEECNKPTFNNNQRETRRHVSLNALNADDNLVAGTPNVTASLMKPEYEQLYRAIEKLRPQQRALLKKVFWEGVEQQEIACEEGVPYHAINSRMFRIYAQLRKILNKKK